MQGLGKKEGQSYGSVMISIPLRKQLNLSSVSGKQFRYIYPEQTS
jgi:hypothetical protein